MDDKKNSTELSPLDTTPATRIKPETAPAEPTPAKKEPQYFPMLHGKATDTIALYGRAKDKDPITGKGIITADGAKAIIDRALEEALAGGINVHKLLCIAIGEFTRLNNIGGDNKESSTIYGVAIPLKEYATDLGYDVIPHTHAGATKEEQLAEKRRADNLLKRARKKIREDLKVLRGRELTWEEKVKGKPEDFISVSIIGSYGIRNGYIFMVFDPAFAEYLLKLPIGQYPIKLLSVDARNPNTYSIGLKLSFHNSIDNNIRRGTNQILKVKTLLAQTNLPNIATIRKQRKSWEERIKEPLENSLDNLYSAGIISEWYYSKSKGIRLTDEEATRFDYESWIETFVHFELANAPDQRERLERKAQAIAKAKKKKRSYKKKSPD